MPKSAPGIVRGFIMHLVSCEREILRILDIRGPRLVGKFFCGSLGLETLHRLFPVSWAEITLENIPSSQLLMFWLCANWSMILQKKAVEVLLGKLGRHLLKERMVVIL